MSNPGKQYENDNSLEQRLQRMERDAEKIRNDPHFAKLLEKNRKEREEKDPGNGNS